MTQTILKKSKNSLKARIADEIEAGIASSQDPENAGMPDLSPRNTHRYSPWYTRTCPQCKLKFREDDQVRLCPQCDQAYHDDEQYNLRCWGRHFAKGRVCKEDRTDPITDIYRKGCDYRQSGRLPDQNDDERPDVSAFRRVEPVGAQFLSGLENIWTPYGQEKLVVVNEDDTMVGLKCPWCRFFIRAGDHAVKCPCGKCNTWFHMDIYRHLTCWNEWNGARGHDHCPTTGVLIENR